MVADKISYCDEPGYRVLDLRPDGVSCIPVLGSSNFNAIRNGADLHFHPGCMEICLCLKGDLIFDTPDREYAFMPGSIFVSSPAEPHHLRGNPSGLKTFRILFSIPRPRQRLLGLDERGSEWIVRSLTHLPKRIFASTPEVRDSFDRLFDTYDNVKRKSPSRRVRMQAAALDLLIAIIDAARRTPAKSPDKINEIAKRIRDRPNVDYPVAELAKECNLSLSSFANAFRQANGLPPHAYVLHRRISKAKTLLLTTQRTVTAIGQELRFYSTQHFAKTFKRIIGVNPQEYRTNNQSLRNADVESE